MTVPWHPPTLPGAEAGCPWSFLRAGRSTEAPLRRWTLLPRRHLVLGEPDGPFAPRALYPLTSPRIALPSGRHLRYLRRISGDSLYLEPWPSPYRRCPAGRALSPSLGEWIRSPKAAASSSAGGDRLRYSRGRLSRQGLAGVCVLAPGRPALRMEVF